MNGYIATTDHDWYQLLRQRPDLDEVNFWQPHGGRPFKTLQPGEPFFFKLKNPYNAICGFGFFARHSVLPAWLVWDSFGIANGASSFAEMRERIEKYRRADAPDPTGQYVVGCLMISQPVFFSPEQFVEQPKDWAKNIVQGKRYDLAVNEGRRVWEECLTRSSPNILDMVAADASPVLERYGADLIVHPRLGQGIFRISVIEAYERACAVTGEHSLPALEAAHIQPYAEGGPHEVCNGILLRSDVHKLFDKGYVSVTEDYHFEVSSRLKQDYDNGKSYYPMHGQVLHLPGNVQERPSGGALRWHNENVFLG